MAQRRGVPRPLLEKARAGLYAKSVVNDVTPERLRRFFVEADGGYRVIKPLRDAGQVQIYPQDSIYTALPTLFRCACRRS